MGSQAAGQSGAGKESFSVSKLPLPWCLCDTYKPWCLQAVLLVLVTVQALGPLQKDRVWFLLMVLIRQFWRCNSSRPLIPHLNLGRVGALLTTSSWLEPDVGYAAQILSKSLMTVTCTQQSSHVQSAGECCF